ncbi:MAG: 4-(cytidine 5'-diphospho)-2-C-methyl-D-erythritol kinase [Gammaproteobacteria bacterium]|nr:4-(cytidine 5'-diphospho)-2-C-methyl-D-erythritol kinase [Gammaproteobacteria bacterium]
MKARAWPAPAKLNLFLHITGRRADGYHLLQTVFQFIDRCDWLHFDVRNDGVIRRIEELPGVPPEQDLTLRAAHLLREEAGQPALGADIRIEKHLPMGGGLGGGSSDAATTLVALNALWGLRLPPQRLAALGLRLGADVPVFVAGHAAWAEGVGEKLTPVTLPEPWYVVLVPACHVSTAAIFSAQELTRDLPPLTIEGFLSGQGRNVCEPVVRSRYPQVAEAMDWLTRFGPARMTGTGACVFCAFAAESEARRVLAQLPPSWQGFVAKGMNRSPLDEVASKLPRL